MTGTAAQVAARLRDRARRAPRTLSEAVADVATAATADAARDTPVDTGLARRSWRAVRVRGGAIVVNRRPRVRFASGGRIYSSALRAVRERFSRARRAIARRLVKEG